MRICLSAPNTLIFPSGGHLWVFVNWALGFKSLGHEVVWLDTVEKMESPEQFIDRARLLQSRLDLFGLGNALVLSTLDGRDVDAAIAMGLKPVEYAKSCDILCDHRYNLTEAFVNCFKRSAMIDIDPGMFQICISWGTFTPARHTHYFTVGEWANFTDTPPFPTHGHRWHHTPPPVALDHWPVTRPGDGAAMTTISGWYSDEWLKNDAGEWYENSKRAAAQAFLDLPRASGLPFEVAIATYGVDFEILSVIEHGWRHREANTLDDPLTYRTYIQQSLGEFSWCKPSYANLQTGWFSDRTACYLASGKPVVVQKTGPSKLFPDDLGVCRFNTRDEALEMLRSVQANYAHHALVARQIAETHLDARIVLSKLLEKVV